MGIKFKIGDKVVVTNRDNNCFSNYGGMALLLGLKNWKASLTPEQGDFGTITAKGLHCYTGKPVYAVNIGGRDFLMAENGIKKYKEPVVKFPFMFKHCKPCGGSGLCYLDSAGIMRVLWTSGEIVECWTKQNAEDFVKKGAWIITDEVMLPEEFYIKCNSEQDQMFIQIGEKAKVSIIDSYLEGTVAFVTLLDRAHYGVVYYQSICELLNKGALSIIDKPDHCKNETSSKLKELTVEIDSSCLDTVETKLKRIKELLIEIEEIKASVFN